jgi:NAD(P)-dependent dehydrogenase (short-subunit alcohol dehydrogenase family)
MGALLRPGSTSVTKVGQDDGRLRPPTLGGSDDLDVGLRRALPGHDCPIITRFMRIDGTVALVTGSERGLGAALARLLARRGARVVASGLAREPLERLRATIAGEGGQALALPCDIRDQAQITSLVTEVTRIYGGVDLLVNNAGVTAGGDIRLLSEADWERVLQVNLLGSIRMVSAVLPGMLARRHGAILNVASAAGLAAPALWIPYATSKFALIGFSEGLHAALRPRGILVSVACPMWIETDMLTSVTPRLGDPPPPTAAVDALRSWGWLTSRVRGRPMLPETAAQRMVRGVERERFMIYTHRMTRLLVAARALAPEVFARLWRHVNEFDERRHRHAPPR